MRPTSERQSVLVIGCGRMGSQIAVEYAATGHRVTVTGRDLDAANARLAQALNLFRRYRADSEEAALAAREAIGDVRGWDSLSLEGIDIAVESVAEDLGLKADLLGQVAAASPAAVLATNTSSIRVSDLGEAAGAPARVIGTHYWNPPLLMPGVEVVSGADTGAEVKRAMVDRLVEMGKVPIAVDRDVSGFVWNRLQAALLREALWLVDNGVASADTIDDAVRFGLAPRATHTGVFRTVELGGVGVWNALMENVLPELSTESRVGDIASRLDGHDRGELAAVEEVRDRGLAARLRELDMS